MLKLQHPNDFVLGIVAAEYANDEYAEFSVPATIEPVKQYAFTLEYCHEGRDGYLWAGHIWHLGKKIIHVQNDGNGGPNWYDPVTAGDRESVKAYIAAAKEAFPTVQYEAEDALTSFLDTIANAIVTA
jgi:signal transduction histidine kinase